MAKRKFRQRKANYPDQKLASKLTIAERTVFQAEVLSLAQLARWEDKFSVTLPFQLQASSSWKARAHRVQVILRTKKRWSWFERAQRNDNELNIRLGTLVHLPKEVRQQIYGHIRDEFNEDQIRRHFGHNWEEEYRPGEYYWQLITPLPNDICGEKLSIFNEGTETLSEVGRAYANLYLTSPSIQIEFEDFYLYRSRIRSLCAKTLRIFLDFLKYMSIQHKTDIPQIYHIILELFADCKCCTQKDSYKDWTTVCLQLPASLRRIEFGLGENSRLITRRHPSGSVWILPRKERLKRAAELLDHMSKQARRSAPEAKIAMCWGAGGDYDFSSEDCDIFSDVLDEVD